jgi:hypothetical protein
LLQIESEEIEEVCLSSCRANGFSKADFTAIDADVKTAIRVGAHPRLVRDGCAVLTKVGERDQYPLVTFLALWEFHTLHPSFHDDLPPLRKKLSPSVAGAIFLKQKCAVKDA